MKNMNRQVAKSIEKINSRQLLHRWDMLRPYVCSMHLQSQVSFFLGALGALAVKKVSP